jgi:hypothetical protein
MSMYNIGTGWQVADRQLTAGARDNTSESPPPAGSCSSAAAWWRLCSRRRRPVWRCHGWHCALLLPPLVAPQATLPSCLPGDAAGSCHLAIGGPKVQCRVHSRVDPPLQELDHPGIGTQHPQTTGTPPVNACLAIPGICGHDSPGWLPAAAGFRPGNLAELSFKRIRKRHATPLVVRF